MYWKKKKNPGAGRFLPSSGPPSSANIWVSHFARSTGHFRVILAAVQQPVTSTETVLQEVEEFPINIEHLAQNHFGPE